MELFIIFGVFCIGIPAVFTIFFLVLYTFDLKPENRIHRQYLGDFSKPMEE